MTSATISARLEMALWIIAALVVIALLLKVDIGYDAKLAPLVVSGDIGEAQTARAFVIKVESVELSHAIAAVSEPGEIALHPLTTAGIWVIVHVRLEARNDPLELGSAVLRSVDGFDYVALDSRAQASFKQAYAERLLTMKTTAPGLPSEGLLAFQIRPSRVAGAHLRVSQAIAGAYLDDVVDIDLGLDSATTRAMLDKASAQFVVRGSGL